MHGESLTRRADRVIAQLAGRQHGVVGRAQLLHAGVSPDQILWRLRSERLHELHRGVYLVGHNVPTQHGRDMATSPPRTILDLAAVLDPEDLERLVAEASYRRLASEHELREQLTTVRRQARRREPAARPRPTRWTESNALAGRVADASPASTTRPHRLRAERRIHGYEVDVLWRELGFAVEIDGYQAHSSRVAFERDRLKIATLKAHGLDVMPVTPRRLRDDSEGVLARLLRALDRVRG
jgi:very-short-patch-repair endonuclease